MHSRSKTYGRAKSAYSQQVICNVLAYEFMVHGIGLGIKMK